MALIDQPGIYYDVADKDYHADPVITPSLSSTIARYLINQTPRHARFNHPRISKRIAEESKPDRPMLIGQAIHKMVLGKGRTIDVLPFGDYRKKEAQMMRDDSLAVGNIPVLEDDMNEVMLGVGSVNLQLGEQGVPDLFKAGKPEVTLVWKEGEVWCRARLDWMPDKMEGHVVIPELKTTAGSALPEDWARTFFDMGYDYQAEFYRRGIMACFPEVKSVEFVWPVLEQDPPHVLSLVRAGGQVEEEAAMLVEAAILLWGHCLATDNWPGYEANSAPLDPPFWRSQSKELRKLALKNRLRRLQGPAKN